MSLLPEINQASAEINKLVAQANIHQTIAPVNPAAFTDPADTLLLASRDPVIREVSVGMTGVEAVQNTVSGTPPLSLTNSLGKPLKAWEVDVLPKQDLNGYDAPWPAGGGANQFDALTWVTLGVNSSNYSVSADETITVLQDDGSSIRNRLFDIDPDASYAFMSTFAQSIRIFSSNLQTLIQDHSGTFTAPSDGKIAVKFYASTYPTSGRFILVKGSSVPAAWSPYSNICPILGTDKLNIFVEESYDPSATPKAVLTLPQTVYTGTIGSEGGESRWGEVDLGMLNWRLLSNHIFYSTPVNRKLPVWQWASEVFKYTTGSIGELTNWSGTSRAGDRELYIRADEYSDATSLKSALSGYKLIYELSTSTALTVPSPTIPTPTGTATTWATAEDGTVESMEVTYYKSE